MANKTLTDLILETRQRANMENTQFVLDAEVTARINAALGELYDIIILADESYYQKQASFALTSAPPTGSSTATIGGTLSTATTNEINLPTDFYRMYGLDVTGAPSPIAVRKFNFAERNLVSFLAYKTLGNLLAIYPYQRAGNTYTFYYTPVPTYLATPSTVTPSSGDAVDSSTNTWFFVNGAFDSTYVGATMTVSGCSNPGNNGTFTILSVTDANDVVTDGTLATEVFGLAATVSFQLLGTSASLDAVMNPWWEYIAVSAAMELAVKEESTDLVQMLGGKKAEIAGRVAAVASGRDDEPDQIPDVTHRTGSRGDYDWWP